MNEELLDEFLNFEMLLRRYQAWQRKGHGPFGNPHRGQGRVLALLKMQPEITQRELTYLLDMRPQSLGELLNKLEKSGYITREPSAEDRRVMVVRLTDSGREVSEEQEENIFASLTEEEQQQFHDILTKLSKAMEEQLPEEALGGRGGFDAEMRRKWMEKMKQGQGGFHFDPRDGGRRHHRDFFYGFDE